MPKALYTSHIKSLPLLHKGKVRDIYDIDNGHMLIVTTDRISAFDVVMPTPIPGKGRILNQVTRFWMESWHISSPTISAICHSNRYFPMPLNALRSNITRPSSEN